jgi:putative endonuclease
MKKWNLARGRLGERAAVKLLKKKGYKILEKNFRTRFGEIDIIAKKRERVIFVEVKTKTGEGFGEPWEMVNKRKLKQIIRMAETYLTKKDLGEAACRVDVVGVWLDQADRLMKIEHWENLDNV